MTLPRIFVLAAALGLPATALAEPPRVVADILPLHSLVTQVMQGVGTADLLLPGGADPHSHALKPSDARALSKADLVLWVGPELMPWLADALPRLAPDARSVALLHAKGGTVLESRQDALFSHAHEEHDDHDDHDGHSHEGDDPHAWLDPDNAYTWLNHIAAELTEIDPDNAETYAQNAEQARARLAEQSVSIARVLRHEGHDHAHSGIFVFHDSYQYFEQRFEVEIAGAISQSDATAPGAARLDQLQKAAAAYDTVCILAEPGFSDKLVKAAAGENARVAVLDPLGSHIPAGPDHYTRLMDEIASAIADCSH